MKLKRLNLKCFGHFSDYVIDLGDGSAFTVVYGLNEAGKSTVLRAIRDFLYGIPARSNDSYLYPPAKMRVEALLEDSSGKELVLARRKGNKNTLLDGENKPVAESFLQQYLGSINRESFSLMFGMDHRSLRRGGEDLLKGRGALGEALFEAASGIGGLREIFWGLEKEAGELFKPSGTRPPLNMAISRYRELKKRAAECSLAPQVWSELEKKYLEEKKRVEQLKREERELLHKKTRLLRLKHTLPLLARWKNYREEMEKLHSVPLLPDSFKEERLELFNKRAAALRMKDQAVKEIKELEKETGEIIIQEELLEYAEDISALQERLDTYRSYTNDMPSFEGEKKELQEEVFALLRQLKPTCSSLQEAESLRLPFALQEEIKRLLHDYPLLEQDYRTARNKVAELEQNMKRQEQEKSRCGPARDVRPLNQLLNRIRKGGNPEEALRKVRSNAESQEQKLNQEMKALGLWSGTLEELVSLPLPLLETVRSFEERTNKIQEQEKRIAEKIEEEEHNLAANQGQLSGADLGGEVPTEEKLEERRKHREYGWYLVRRAWLEGVRRAAEERSFNADHPLPLAYEMSVKNADELADRLRYETARVERKTHLLSQVEKSREKIAELKNKQEELLRKSRQLERDWVATWEKTGITPLAPSGMLAWLKRCHEIIQGIDTLEKHHQEERELQLLLIKNREELDSAFSAIGEPGVSEQESLEMLLERAQEVCSKYQVVETRLQGIESICKEIEENLEQARQQKEEARSFLDSWSERWNEVLQRAGLPQDITKEAVSAYLEKLEMLFQKKDELAQKQANLEKMRKYKRDFESCLQQLLERLDLELGHLPPDQKAAELQALASKTQRNKDKRDNMERQLEKAKAGFRKAEKDVDEAASGLKLLMDQARCREESELPEVEEKAERLKKLRENIEDLEKQLLSHGGGMSLQEIREETEGVDGDFIPAEIEDIELELQKKDEEQAALNRSFGVTKKEYEDTVEGASTEAVEAAEEAQGALADLKMQTEHYLRLRLASVVLRRGIERYREENQSPVIKQAGYLFARLTKGSFDGLKIDYDEQDNPIMLGLRPDKEEVTVGGMSDGTLDQLYLSLRLASLGRYLDGNEPLPFILDDLLVNFDHARAAETLKVLVELAQHTQVLFFTHHSSLVSLAKKTTPPQQINIVEL